MSTDIFAPDHNDPFAMTFICRQLAAGKELDFYKAGARLGKIVHCSRARGGFGLGGQQRGPVKGFYVINYQFGGEILTLGECSRLKFVKHGGVLQVHLPSQT